MTDYVWKNKARIALFITMACILLFALLGGRELWTMESRWADIVMNFFYRQDFFHPVLHGQPYYDKPLLSYWFMALLSKLSGGVTLWALRAPSAIAGLVSLWAIYRLGEKIIDRRYGVLSASLLLTTFYFIFWARVASADMLNLAGVLLAVLWYVSKKEHPGFLHYTVFFLILALTSLCKGLLGVVLPLLIIVPDLIHQAAWKKHRCFSVFPAMLPAVFVYSFPFLLSLYFGGGNYHANGFAQVFRENIVRFFHPFDHVGPFYTYFIYLPLYLLPWTFFFIPALCTLPQRWSAMSWPAKWMVWATALVFIFFSASLSKRSYYILPLLPYAILMTAEWIYSKKLSRLAKRVAVSSYALLFFIFIVIMPFYYSDGGPDAFARQLKQQLMKEKSWKDWHFVLLGTSSKLPFYLQAAHEPVFYKLPHDSLRARVIMRDVLKSLRPNQVVITTQYYQKTFQTLLPGYTIAPGRLTLGDRLLHKSTHNLPIAFIKE